MEKIVKYGITHSSYTALENANDKYKDKYLGTLNDRTACYNANTRKYGDAVYETSSYGNSNAASWNSSRAVFLCLNSPLLTRGGPSNIGAYAGIFSFFGSGVGSRPYTGFRPVVVNSQP